ncbi:MAG: 3-isopropylmalate dehydratase small subunit [Rhodoferax sp.]|nr:3-isopropylmalate dehydratase small subunit [Rhodoferax sp.]
MPDATISHLVAGRAAAIPIENLDTDQIMPKQFLRGIDKAGLARGLLYNLRFDADGAARPGFVLNRPEAQGVRILVGGANFGCGSSREHAVWGLQQYGIDAVIAPSFGEIFYSNAMNNRLLLVMLPDADVAALMADAAARPGGSEVVIDVERQRVRGGPVDSTFTLSVRHRRMFLEGLDVIGLSLAHAAEIDAFADRHWAAEPWVRDVARRTCDRLVSLR